MLGLSANLRYFLCCHSTDMRNGFDGLAGIVRNYLGKNPVSGDVFIFVNKTRTHIKMLLFAKKMLLSAKEMLTSQNLLLTSHCFLLNLKPRGLNMPNFSG